MKIKTRIGRIFLLILVLVLTLSFSSCHTNNIPDPENPVIPPDGPIIESDILDITESGNYIINNKYLKININAPNVTLTSGYVPLMNIISGNVTLNGVTTSRVVLKGSCFLTVNDNSSVTKLEVEGSKSTADLFSSLNELLVIETASDTKINLNNALINIIGLASKVTIIGNGTINTVITNNFSFYDSDIPVDFIAYDEHPYNISEGERNTSVINKPIFYDYLDMPSVSTHKHDYNIDFITGFLKCDDCGNSIRTPYVAYLGENNEIVEVYTLNGSLPNGVTYDAAARVLTYTNNGSAKKVVIFTTDGSLIIDAPNDVVNHYGYAEMLDIKSVDYDTSYHEFGSVAFARIVRGHLLIENRGVVNIIFATGDLDGVNAVRVDNNGGKVGKAYAINDSIANTENEQPKQPGNIILVKDDYITDIIITTLTIEDIGSEVGSDSPYASTLNSLITENTFRGNGREVDPYLISSEYELILLSEKSKSDSFYRVTFRLENSLNMLNFNWIPIGSNDEFPFKATFEGNSKSIYNLTSTHGGLVHYAGSGMNIEELSLVNVNISGKKVGGFVNTTTKLDPLEDPYLMSFSLINSHISGGRITSTDKLGGLIGEAYGPNGSSSVGRCAIFDCSVTLEQLETSAYRVGGLIGYSSCLDAIIHNCTVNASPKAKVNNNGEKWVGGLIGGAGYLVNFDIDDFTFNGTAQSIIVPARSASGHAFNNVGLVNSSGEFIVGATSIHTANHTLGGALYDKDELNSRPYIISCLETHYKLKSLTDADYYLCSWSNDNGFLYYYRNGYTGPSGTVPAPNWAGDFYGVLASGANQNNPMYNTNGIVPMGDCNDPQTLLWLVVEIPTR